MIYSALSNGPKTYIVTRDELRDHFHLMKTMEMRQMFRRWQRQHQMYPISMGRVGKYANLEFTFQVGIVPNISQNNTLIFYVIRF